MNHDNNADQLENGKCRDCGKKLGAGYLCDECDTVEVEEPLASCEDCGKNFYLKYKISPHETVHGHTVK